MINYKLQNKIVLRNFSESSDKHDLIKTQLYRLLRRKYKNCPIYTEYQLKGEIPDIYLESKEGIIIYEIQKEVTTKWLKEITKKYKDIKLTIIETKKISNNIDEMRKQLNEFV